MTWCTPAVCLLLHQVFDPLKELLFLQVVNLVIWSVKVNHDLNSGILDFSLVIIIILPIYHHVITEAE